MDFLSLDGLQALSLDGLEALVLHSPRLQRFVVRAHRRALTGVLEDRDAIRNVAVVGGGLFPRTALILRDLMPEARVVIIDASRSHLDLARAFLDSRPAPARPVVEFRHETFVAGEHASCRGPGGEGFDLVVVPMAFKGDRKALYANPPAPRLLVHDWCWRVRGTGRMVSFVLLKRLNLIRR